ncbi:MAG: helix-turn-helix transcriptional regulator [Planctomycetota bacterium]
MAKKAAAKRKRMTLAEVLNVDTGQVLAVLRGDGGLSLRRIESETGVNRSTLSRIANGKIDSASAETYRRLMLLAVDHNLF